MRSPFFRDLNTFDARERNAVTVYQLVAPLTQAALARSHRRDGEARRRLVMAMPVSVTR